MTVEAKTFEENLGRLQEIVAALEGDALPLHDALALFEEGVERLRGASGELARVESRLKQLVEEDDGSFTLADLAG